MMHVEPVTLEGRTVRLEPLTLDHALGLWRVAQPDPDMFDYTWVWVAHSDYDAFRENVRSMISRANRVTFAIVLAETDEPIGSTSYLDIRPEHRGLEIGATWIGRAYQGTQVNPENKYLLLRHAFEQLGAVRVQLKTDGRNLHSQRAIARLGAKLEGVLRKHLIVTDDYVRDTVMFSIIDDEWPAVKAALEERLGYVP